MMENNGRRYRVFVSYSHDDAALVDNIRDHVASLGLDTYSDRDLRGGLRFQDQIELLIAHARLFIPVITDASMHRGWVQQEIGYAYGKHIPILPVCIQQIPDGMIGQFQAINLKNDLSDLTSRLTRSEIDTFVERSERECPPTYECARDHTERGRLLTRYADIVRGIGRYGCVRQKGALTSFHIPETPLVNRDWRDRYDSRNPMPSRDHLNSLKDERWALERHTHQAGCRLIIEPFVREYRMHDLNSFRCRIQKLIQFLHSMSDDKVVTAVKSKHNCDRSQSLTIVGDWFSAESVTVDATGYRHTIFTRNAATIYAQHAEFEDELTTELSDQGINEQDSRVAAIDRLQEIVDQNDAPQ